MFVYNNSIRKNNDASVELLRIIACIFVISVHVKLPDFDNKILFYDRVLINCLVGDGVAIFWIIMGFFIFNNKSFRTVCKKCLNYVVVPTLIYVILANNFERWINNGVPFIYCLTNPQFDILNTVKCILTWSAGTKLGFHLWFVFVYVQNILWYPVLKPLGEQGRYRIYLILLCIVYLIISDIQNIITLSFVKIIPFTIINASLLQMMIGYELYKRYRIYFQSKYKIICYVYRYILY